MSDDTDITDQFQPLAIPVAAVMGKISHQISHQIGQASVGARGSAASTPSGADAVAGLGGTALEHEAGAARFPLPIPNQPLFICATLKLCIGHWPISDIRAEYIVHHTCDGAIKLMGVRVLAENGCSIDINRGGSVALDDNNTLVSYMAIAIWAAADTQFEDVKARIFQKRDAARE